MSEFKALTEQLNQFRDARDWRQFHKPKDLIVSMMLEAAEVLEHVQWKSDAELSEYLKTHKVDMADELADVLNYLLLIAHDLDIDLHAAAYAKLEKTGEKYPVDKAKGNKAKYTELRNT